MIYELWKAGEAKRLERKKRRVCFHVLSVNIALLNTHPGTSFWTPITDAEYDQWLGLFAWNDWFFNEWKTRPELDPALLRRTREEKIA